jgi:hypothetical protein
LSAVLHRAHETSAVLHRAHWEWARCCTVLETRTPPGVAFVT